MQADPSPQVNLSPNPSPAAPAGELLSFEPKFFLRSKTVLSAIVLALPQILGAFGVAFTDADAQHWLQVITTVLGALGVVWGRTTARQPLHFGGAFAPLLLLAFCALLGGCSSLPLPKAKVTYHSQFGDVSYDGKTLKTDLHGELAPGLSVEGR